MSPEEVKQLLSGLDQQAKHRLAKDENIFEVYGEDARDILSLLSQDTDWFVRAGVAVNPKTPPHLLIAMRNDKHPSVLCALANNVCCPMEVQWDLASNSNTQVRFCLATNPNVYSEAVKRHPYNFHKEWFNQNPDKTFAQNIMQWFDSMKGLY